DDILLQFVQVSIVIAIVQFAQELLFRMLISSSAIAADAHAQDAGSATFALRLQDSVENHLPAAIQIAIGFEFFVGQGILRADVFATTALEHQSDGDSWRAMLMKMYGW